MAARLIGFIIIGLIAFAVILVGVYLIARNREPKRHVEMDVSARPSMWWVDSRAAKGGTVTEISIVRVDSNTYEILERRILRHIRNEDIDYAMQLDAGQDAAYEAARKANLGLVRR